MNQIFKICYFLALFSVSVSAQTLDGIVIDGLTKRPLDLATIFFKDSKYTIFSDAEGKFSVEINPKDKIAILVISSIGYEDLEIDLKGYSENRTHRKTFELAPKVQLLDEIVISNEKIDYGSPKTINSKRTPRARFSFQFGTENVTFVQNPYFKNGKIKKVILSLDKLKKNNAVPKWVMDYVTAYSVKFYKYDARNQKPGEELYSKNIIAEPENKSYDFIIDVDSLNIPFPKEGVCIGIEYLNTRYKNPKGSFALIGPSMNFYEEEKLKPIIAWSRYKGEDWEFKSSISIFKNRRYQNVMVVDLVVNMEN